MSAKPTAPDIDRMEAWWSSPRAIAVGSIVVLVVLVWASVQRSLGEFLFIAAITVVAGVASYLASRSILRHHRRRLEVEPEHG